MFRYQKIALDERFSTAFVTRSLIEAIASYASSKFLHINLIQRKIRLAVVPLKRFERFKHQMTLHFMSYLATFVPCMYLKREWSYRRFRERPRRSRIAIIMSISTLSMYRLERGERIQLSCHIGPLSPVYTYQTGLN